jgi:hypothetical protein
VLEHKVSDGLDLGGDDLFGRGDAPASLNTLNVQSVQVVRAQAHRGGDGLTRVDLNSARKQ